MATGTVKWFNPAKRFGFVQPDGGDKDVFIHITALEAAGLNSLPDGQRIQYDLADQNGKASAVNLKLI